jgi:hypothetical protein
MTALSIVDKDALRRTAPLASVCQALGVKLDEHGYASCPFHADNRPSFNIYVADDGVQRWGCFPCGKGGDAFDLVQRIRGLGFGDALRFVAEIADDAPRVTPRQRVTLDPEALGTYVSSAMARGLTDGSLGWLCVASGLSGLPDKEYDAELTLMGWGVDEAANVVIPHWDHNSLLTGCKVRAPDGHKWSFPGSSYTSLYGSWRYVPRENREILLLCEGETDMAHAQHQLRSDTSSSFIDVRSLPSGATTGRFPDAWVDVACAWDVVYLAFDGDEAGDAAEDLWVEKFHERDLWPELRALPVPRGEDLRSCGVDVSSLMRRAVAV